LKKYIKETLIAIVLIFIVSNVIGYFRSVNVKAKDNYTLLLNKKTINGTSVKELLSQKKPLILNFWGTWCPVCKQEVSTLSNLAKREDIILLSVAVNSGSNEKISEYLKQKKIKFLVINDYYGKLAKAFNISVYPTTIFFSKNRKNIIKDSGYTTKAGFLGRVKLLGDN